MPITKITIGRLYNLGSYEHVRYELTAEISESEQPSDAYIGMSKILNALRPVSKCGVRTESEIAHKTKEVESMRTMPAVQWERQYGHCKGSPAEVVQRYQESLDEEIRKREQVLERHKQARELLNNLGGAAEWKDSKLEWDNDDSDYYD